MKKITTSLFICLVAFSSFAQNTKVVDSPNGTVISNLGGTDIPHSSSILDIRSTNKGILLPRMLASSRDAIISPQQGLLIYNTSTNQFDYHNGTSWQQLYLGNQWSVNGTSYYYNAGNVGIGTNVPGYPLEVIGNARISNRLAVNDPFPDYNLDVNGTAGIETLGIGGAVPNATYPLDVLGNTRLQSSLSVFGTTTITGTTNLNTTTNVGGTLNANSNLVVDGTATINNGKGVAYNPASATNLRVYPFTTGTFNAVLPGFGLSAEGGIIFGGNFTSAPKVFVGDIDVTGGSAGELYRVQLILYGCKVDNATNSSCKARLLNTSPNAVNYSITWNCVAIGN
ncbi:hypothetical protein GCM10011514_01210 [Emticicia aquatilis]|uniref:Chlorovirus glycoprotein repeat domain-containing protein n=1 Tax=Emticicia aquatilis TaxID=1537369 RepID=A0A916YDH5_9BACT|nr:hypothetical protein [Emticicia aquatilis]GGD40900.1 hypothetical protein GCM10011514_01210 [Emticicia aquatilis]